MDGGLELGLDTFGDVTVGADGRPLPRPEVIRDVLEEAVLADEVGVDAIGIGEHHRADFAVSSPEMVLAAIAGRTRRIRLGSAVTVLSSDDPVRVFQRFSTLDAVSGGRAEVTLGRGSFTESFPLFGIDLDRYEELFEDRLDLFVELLAERPVTWTGTTRAALDRPTGLPPDGVGPPGHLGRGGREPPVGGPGRPLRAPADDRHHRRGERALRPPGRPLPPGVGGVRSAPTPGRCPFTWARGASDARHENSCGRT